MEETRNQIMEGTGETFTYHQAQSACGCNMMRVDAALAYLESHGKIRKVFTSKTTWNYEKVSENG